MGVIVVTDKDNDPTMTLVWSEVCLLAGRVIVRVIVGIKNNISNSFFLLLQ